jgi:hypothetical protein
MPIIDDKACPPVPTGGLWYREVSRGLLPSFVIYAYDKAINRGEAPLCYDWRNNELICYLHPSEEDMKKIPSYGDIEEIWVVVKGDES